MCLMLIDRLRSHADLYDGTKEPPLEPKLQRPYLARELREAADTISELRDDLQRVNTENDKFIVKLNAEHIVRQNVEIENKKIRELFYEAWDWMQRARYDRSIRDDEMDEIGAKAVELGFPDYELGIEVDG